ncbi:MAG: cadherin repeat domain-containing protein [Candidatus Omnitrophota bacterium]
MLSIQNATSLRRIHLIGLVLLLGWFPTVLMADSAPTDILLNPIPDGAVTNPFLIDENLPIGTVVGEFSTVDPDADETFEYVFTEPYYDATYFFRLEENKLILAGWVSYEWLVYPSLVISVKSIDSSGMAVSKSFEIRVNNVAESPKDIQLFPAEIAENSPLGTVVGRLSAADEDAYETFTYSFVSPYGDADGKFVIDGDQLKVNGDLNYEIYPSLLVTVLVQDSKGLVLAKTFEIKIKDVNERPTNIVMNPADPLVVDENALIGTILGWFSMIDEDLDKSSYYTFTAPYYNANGLFALEGNALKAAQVLDYESLPHSLLVSIQAADSGGLTLGKTFEIKLNDANDPPYDISLYPNWISRGAQPNDIIGYLSSKDVDSSASPFAYSFAEPYLDAGGYFKIEGNELRLAKPVDAGALPPSLVVTVASKDAGGMTLSKSLEIGVMVGPKDILADFTLVKRNAKLETVVSNLSTSHIAYNDPSQFVYNFVGPYYNASGVFALKGNQLVLTRELSQIPYSSLLVSIESKDPVGVTLAKTFVISIVDEENPLLDILLTPAHAEENSPIGSLVGVFSSIGLNEAYTYSFDEPYKDANGLFRLEGNQLKVGGLLDYESQTSLLITVRSTSAGGWTWAKTFDIKIVNINEGITDVVLSPANVNENSPFGTFVGTLSSVDLDTKDAHTYSFVDPYRDANGLFYIEGDKLLVGGALDYETLPNPLLVSVQSKDIDGLTMGKTFAIALNDIDDKSSNIYLNSNAVASKSPAGTVVGSFSTEDVDAGETFTYAFTAPYYNASSLLRIDGAQLITAAPLDAYVDTTLLVSIEARGSRGGSLGKTFEIYVVPAKELLRVEFVEDSINETNFSYSAPGGFNLAALSVGGAPPDSIDGRALIVTAKPGEGVLGIMKTGIAVGSDPVLISMSLQADVPGCSAAIVGLNSPIDNQLGYTLASGADVPVGKMGKVELLYAAPNAQLQPALQVTVPSSAAGPVTVYIDNLTVSYYPSPYVSPAALDVDGSFEGDLSALVKNVNGDAGTVESAANPEGGLGLLLSVGGGAAAANAGAFANALQGGFPQFLQAAVDARLQSGAGGAMALVMTNNNSTIALFVNNSTLPGAGGPAKRLTIGGGFSVENSAMPILCVVQNGAPGMTSAVLVDNLSVSRIIK